MDRDQAIRTAVRGLTGVARERAIEKLLRNPERIPWAMGGVLNPRPRRHWLRNASGRARTIKLAITVTPEQYVELRDTAALERVSIASLVRRELFGEKRSDVPSRRLVSQKMDAWAGRRD